MYVYELLGEPHISDTDFRLYVCIRDCASNLYNNYRDGGELPVHKVWEQVHVP